MYPTSSIAECLSSLQSSKDGLKTAEITKRQAQFGRNELPEHHVAWWKILLSQFKDIMIYILLAALILSVVAPFFEEHPISWLSFMDAYVIGAILLLNAVLGFVQEFKAEKAIEMLKKLSAPRVRVRRDGQEQMLASVDLVPGDIVITEAGDLIAADGRILQAAHLHTNESSLTGEVNAIEKQTDTLKEVHGIADQKNMLFSGTLVTQGSGEYLVTAIGSATQIGKIATLVAETLLPETPLQTRMKQLSRVLGSVVLALCLVIIVVGYQQGLSLLSILLIGLSLAVSAVPEGLPAVVTICLAMGVRRMIKKNALVRRIASLEALGSVTVICSDKTGTITQNRMVVLDTWLAKGASADTLLQIAASCNHAQLPDLGDPTEVGLLQYADKQGAKRLPIDDEEVPFTSKEKYMQTRHGQVSFLKGAPEVIAELCNKGDTAAMLKETEAMAAKGLRVLAAAQKTSSNIELVGLLALEDPPRPTAKQALVEARQAGIRTVMITGDNKKTAHAIAQQVGIEGEAMEGKELDQLKDKEWLSVVKTVSVYARVSPEHKLKILKALQENGEIVAMTGDGVNDAPALKGAHVGVAMGKVGTEVAREAASIVLADDQYSTIVAAVAEGRRIYDNIRKFVVFLLRANFDELLFITTVIMLGMPLPYLPVHILLVNLLTDSLPALALGMEKAEPDIMDRPPRPVGQHILAGESGRLVIAAVVGFGVSLVFYLHQLNQGYDLQTARTAAVLLAVIFELCLVFSIRSTKPLYQIGLFSNRWLLGAVALPFALIVVLIYTPLQSLFYFSPVNAQQWLEAIGLALGGLVLFELLKLAPGRKVLA